MNKDLLLIEDFPVIQKLYGDYLKEHGFEVDLATDGKMALEKVQNKEYDFILVDLLLPRVNGIVFLEQFKNRPEQTKVIVLSDFYEPEIHKRAKELGVLVYLIKAEHTPSQLVEKLESYSSK